MKRVPAFEVLPPERVTPFIRVSDAGMIVVGEEGRNRIRVDVPLPEGSVVRDGAVIEIPVSSEEAAAVVLIRDFAGFRGSWDLVEPLELDVIREFIATNADDRVLLQHMRTVEPPRCVARGRCAQGIAGRMGSGDEILYVAAEGETYDIIRWGRVYGAPRILRVAVVEGRVVLTAIIRYVRTLDAASRW
jgi:hypothetical protein